MGLETTREVFEVDDEPILSMLFDHKGERIPYKSKKLGHIGFYPLKERDE